jgi:hypothetical protein
MTEAYQHSLTIMNRSTNKNQSQHQPNSNRTQFISRKKKLHERSRKNKTEAGIISTEPLEVQELDNIEKQTAKNQIHNSVALDPNRNQSQPQRTSKPNCLQ